MISAPPTVIPYQCNPQLPLIHTLPKNVHNHLLFHTTHYPQSSLLPLSILPIFTSYRYFPQPHCSLFTTHFSLPTFTSYRYYPLYPLSHRTDTIHSPSPTPPTSRPCCLCGCGCCCSGCRVGVVQGTHATPQASPSCVCCGGDRPSTPLNVYTCVCVYVCVCVCVHSYVPVCV
jgi:hypothetical protein